MVAAADLCSLGHGDAVQKSSTYCGTSSSVKTLIKNIRKDSESMETTVKNVLHKHDFIVAALDNDQKGFPKKFNDMESATSL